MAFLSPPLFLGLISVYFPFLCLYSFHFRLFCFYRVSNRCISSFGGCLGVFLHRSGLCVCLPGYLSLFLATFSGSLVSLDLCLLLNLHSLHTTAISFWNLSKQEGTEELHSGCPKLLPGTQVPGSLLWGG